MRALPFLLALATPLAAQERSLRCEAEALDGSLPTPVTVVLDDDAGDVPANCVAGPAELIWRPGGSTASLIACAPQGGWSLTDADGSVRFVTSVQGVEHDGLWFFARLGPSELVASASVGTAPPLALEVAGDTVWRMRLDMATLTGAMWTREGERALACSPS